MDSKHTNNNHQNTERESERGEPCFVFTEYDRGARPNENQNQGRSEETAETESHRPQN